MTTSTTQPDTPAPAPERRSEERLKEIFVTRTQYYAGGAVIFMAVLAALSWVYNGARNGAQDAARAEVAAAKNEIAKPVAALDVRVTATELDVKGVKEQVKALDEKVDKTKASLEGAIADSERSVKDEVKAARQDVSNLTQLLLTGKVSPPPGPRR